MKKKMSLLGIFAAMLLLMSFVMSDFYSSLTTMDYDNNSKSLTIKTKLNTKHLSDALKINPNTAGFEASVKQYIGKNLGVHINGTQQSLTFNGYQVSEDAVWITAKINDVSDIKTLKIKNSILLEFYPRQVNLVNIAYKGTQKNMTLLRGKDTAEAAF